MLFRRKVNLGLLDTLLNTIEQGVVLFDSQNRIIFKNIAAKKILNLEPDGLISTLVEFLAESKSEEKNKVITFDHVTVEVSTHEINVGRHVHKLVLVTDRSAEKQLRDKLTEAESALSNNQDAALNIMEDLERRRREVQLSNIALASEITERQRAQDELAKYQDHLENLVEARTAELLSSQEQLREAEHFASLGALAAGIAHEINNPVGAILLCAQNALEEAGDPHDQASLVQLFTTTLDKVIENSRRCGRIVKGVLQFSRSHVSQKSLHEINFIIRRSAEVMQSELEQGGARILFDLSKDLPLVNVNPVEMEQVFVNIFQNALDTGKSGLELKIKTSLGESDVLIIIADNGPGISFEDQSRVFNPFFTKRLQRGGTGLGLSIVHGIVSAHEGRIKLESQPGRGTRIIISLPACDREYISDMGMDRYSK